MMTARDVFERAIALIDETEASGAISTDTAASYEGAAPRVIDVLQRELALYENIGVTDEIVSLEDSLVISEDTAARIMPYGLAASFALADKNGDMHSEYSYMYRSLVRTMGMEENDVVDVYDVLGGM